MVHEQVMKHVMMNAGEEKGLIQQGYVTGDREKKLLSSNKNSSEIFTNNSTLKYINIRTPHTKTNYYMSA